MTVLETAEPAPCRFALCGELRRVNSRGLTRKGTRMEDSLIADLNVLYPAFLASMKGSSWKEEPQRFEIDFLSELVKLKRELKARTYKVSPGIEFEQNERGKIRYIHGRRIRDRVVRHALCDDILSKIVSRYIIPNNCASQKGKGITAQRNNFERDLHNYYLKYGTNNGYIVFFDLSKFYDNIQHDKVRDFFYPKLKEPEQWLVGEMLTAFEIDVSYMTDDEYAMCLDIKFDSLKYHAEIPEELRTGEKMMAKSVDIGDQASQDIGVVFPTRMDNYAKIVRGIKEYGRYMDDIYAIVRTREEAETLISDIEDQAKQLGLFLNKKKTRIEKLSGKYTYLQIKYSLSDKGKAIKRINPKSVTRERRRLKAYRRLMDKGVMLYEDVENSYKCWMGSFVRLMSKEQIKHMKALYKNLFGKETRWKKQK